jgi:hypothetical protein
MGNILHMLTIETDLAPILRQGNRLLRHTALFGSSQIVKNSAAYNGTQTALSRPRYGIH